MTLKGLYWVKEDGLKRLWFHFNDTLKKLNYSEREQISGHQVSVMGEAVTTKSFSGRMELLCVLTVVVYSWLCAWVKIPRIVRPINVNFTYVNQKSLMAFTDIQTAT